MRNDNRPRSTSLTLDARAAARAAFDALMLARTPPDALLHRACTTFAQMVAEMTEQRCEVIVGRVVIAREAA